MAVIETSLIRTGGRVGIPGQHRFQNTYRVVTDAWMSVDSIYNSTGSSTPHSVPRIDSVGPFGTYVQSVDIEPEKAGNFTRWTATVTYAPPPTGRDPAVEPDPTGSPLDQPVRYRVEWERVLHLVEKDKDGNPILNRARDPFTTPIEQERSIPVLVAMKNYATLDEIISIGIDYDRAVNSEIFHGGAVRTVRFAGIITSGLQTLNSIQYYPAELRFTYRAETWDDVVVNRGFHAWDITPTFNEAGTVLDDPVHGRPARKEWMLDDTGQRIAEPALLSVNGTRLEPGKEGNTITFRTRPEKDFNELEV